MAEPRFLVLPPGIVSTAWPKVRDVCAEVGISFDPWQQDLARAMLAKDEHGNYAAEIAAMSICRQSGKTFAVAGLVFAEGIIHPGSTTVWTAHRFKTARETFNALRALATLPGMAPHVDPDAITTGAGNEAIPFRNGSRIVFAARERGAIRGYAKVRRLVLDEAQILTEAAMSDLAPTTNQAENPQVILMGTPPRPRDPSEVFTAIRSEALDGPAEGVLWCEYGAEADCDLDAWESVEQANPSFPFRTPKRAIRRLRKLLATDDDFAREALGIWGGSATSAVIDADTWAAVADETSAPIGRLALAVDVSPERDMAAVAVAGQRPDGAWHVELDEHRRGVGWLSAYVAARCERNDIRAVVIDGASPAASIIDDLAGRKVKVTATGARDMAHACGTFFDGVTEGWLHHIDQPQLTAALATARRRPLGDAWAWNRKSSASDITPLVACTLALWGAQSSGVKKPVRRSGGRPRAVVL